MRYKQDWLKYKKYISSHIESSPALDSENDVENCVDKINNVLLSASNTNNNQKIKLST